MTIVRRVAGVLAGLVLAGIAAVVVFGPFARTPDPGPTPEGRPPWIDKGRAVALLAHSEAVGDLAWIDLLESVFGGVDVIRIDPPEGRPDVAPTDRSILVLGHETTRRTRPADWRQLDGFVDSGGVLYLETPEGAWAELGGVDVASVERRDTTPWPGPRTPAAAFTVERGTTSPGSVPRPSIAVPLSSWRYGPRREGGTSARPRVSAGGRPAVWARSVERGAIVSLSHHVSRLTSELRRRTGTGPTTPHAWADAWIQVSLAPDAAPWPWPRWSNAPAGDDGWLLLCAPASVPTPLPVTRFVRAGEAVATDAGGVETLWPHAGAWERAPASLRREVRWGPLPVHREVLPTVAQVDMVRPHGGPTVHRFAGRGPDDREAGRAALAAAGIRADLSHGPQRGTPGGFVAGTGRPRVPFSPSGGQLGYVDLPHLARWATVDAQALATWARNNARGTAGPLTLHVDTPAGVSVQDERFLGHRFADVDAYLDWWDGRRRARLHWGRDRDQLVVTVDVPADLEHGLALLLPRSWRDRVLVDWSAPWSPARSRRVRRYDATPWLEIGVPAGTRATLRATYAPMRR